MAKEIKIAKGDSEQGSVGKQQRRNMFALAFVFAGWGLNSSEIISGGTVAGPLGLKLGITVIIVGTLVNCLLGVLTTIPGVKTGLGFAMLSRHAFGEAGSKIPSAVISVVHFGWYGILTAMLASITIQILPNWSFAAVAIIAGLSIAIVATVGIKANTIIGYLAVPCVLIVGLIGVIRLLTGTPIDPMLTVGGESTFTQSLSQCIGAFAVGSLLACDVGRFAQTKLKAAIGVMIGLFVGLGFVRILGALSILSTGVADIVLAFGAMGMAGAGFIFLFLNIVSTTDNILYSTGMSLANIIPVDRKILTLIAGVLGTIVAVTGLDSIFGAWLNFLAAIIPALGGVVVADFYILKGSKYCAVEKIGCRFNVFALIGWGAGIGISQIGIFCGAIDGLIGAGLVYLICMYIVKAAKPEYFAKLTNAGEEPIDLTLTEA